MIEHFVIRTEVKKSLMESKVFQIMVGFGVEKKENQEREEILSRLRHSQQLKLNRCLLIITLFL